MTAKPQCHIGKMPICPIFRAWYSHLINYLSVFNWQGKYRTWSLSEVMSKALSHIFCSWLREMCYPTVGNWINKTFWKVHLKRKHIKATDLESNFCIHFINIFWGRALSLFDSQSVQKCPKLMLFWKCDTQVQETPHCCYNILKLKAWLCFNY